MSMILTFIIIYFLGWREWLSQIAFVNSHNNHISLVLSAKLTILYEQMTAADDSCSFFFH